MLVLEDFFNHVKIANKKYKHYNGVDVNDYKDYLKSFDDAMLFEIDYEVIREDLNNIYSELDRMSIKDKQLAIMNYIDSFPVEQLNLPCKSTYITVKNIEYIPELDVRNGFTSMLITHDLIAIYNYSSDHPGTKADHIYYQYGIWYTNNLLLTHMVLINAKVCLDVINSYRPIISNHLNIKNYRPKCNLLNKKRLTKTPNQFYVINVNNSLKNHAPSSEVNKRCSYEKSYAYQVMGHFKYRIMVGDLPMEDKVRKYLTKNPNRKIITKPSDLDDKYRKILNDRQIEYKEGQWMSIVECHVESYIANSKNGKNKFIPSVRVMS